MRVIARLACRAQPWKNGGGITHEIWRTPDHGDPDLRVSLAEVARSGPFSRFPGYRRWSFLAGTAPIAFEVAHEVAHGRTSEVAHERAIELVVPGDHIELPGETSITASLPAGPTHLLNVLVRLPLVVAGAPPIVVGRGPITHPVRFVFALAPRPGLARWEAAVLDPPELADTTDCIWIT